MNLKELNFDMNNLREKFDSLSTTAKVGAGFAALSTTYVAFNYTKYLFWRHQQKKNKFNAYTTNDEALMGKDLSGRVAIVTGCNTGIGYQTAKSLVKHGCCVVMACRTQSKAVTARQKLMEEVSVEDGINVDEDQLIVMKLDLSDLSSVLEFSKNFNAKKLDLHYLINNAGLVCPDYRTSKDGYELQFATMHLGHFYLTRLLWDNLEATGEKEKGTGFKSRVINLTSIAHSFLGDYKFISKMFDSFIKNKAVMSDEYKKYYHTYFNYGIAKTCNILFSRELAYKMCNNNSNVVTYAAHPGADMTSDLGRDGTLRDNLQPLFWLIFIEPSMSYKESKSPLEIASTTLYCVAQNLNKLENGGYYANCGLGKKNGRLYYHSACAYEIRNDSHELGEKIWRLSEILIQDKGFSLP